MSLFQAFAELNDALAATTKKLEKRALIASYLQSLPIEDAGRAALWFAGTPFPETDPRVLNIGGSLLSKAVAQLSAATSESMSAAYRRYGDFGSAAADLLYGRAPTTAGLTLFDVEAAFSALAAARGPAPKLRLLLDLLARAIPVEAKYLIKLITGDMRTGVKQSLVEEAIAEAWPPSAPDQTSSETLPAAASAPAGQAAVRRATMLTGSLPAVVAFAASGRLHEARMTLFHPIGFMLASPVQSTDEALARITDEIKAELGSDKNASDKENSVKGNSAVPNKAKDLAFSAPATNDSEIENSVILSEAAKLSRPHLARQTIQAQAEGPAFRSSALRAAQLEDKYDGIRAQLHISAQRVALYSRNRDDLSAAFPDLTAAFSSIAEPAILDGEILAWNPASNPSAQRALPFAALQQRLGRKRVTPEMLRQIPAVLVVFDILYRGETLLLDQPLAVRRSVLEDFCARWSPGTVLTPSPTQPHLFEAPPEQGFPRLILAPATVLSAETVAAPYLDQAYRDARARGNEGLMLKSLASLYQPGRRGLAWLKLKRELATLDVVVTGVEYGNGRRAAVLSDYTFAVRDTDALDPADPSAPVFKNVGKAYSGLTDQEIAEMTTFFKAHTLVDNGHFRTVEPLVVLEVAFNNVMRSSRHASGFALRFPRILRIRNDKPVAEIDTLRRVEEIYASQPDKPLDP